MYSKVSSTSISMNFQFYNGLGDKLFFIFVFITLQTWSVVGQKGLAKRPLIAEDCSVDILFVLDASGSVRADFTNMRDFVADVAKTLTVSATGHRVSLLEYSGPSLQWPRYPFGFVSSTDEFVEFISRLPFLQGTTATGKALNVALNMLEDRRRNVITLVIVVTDGYSFDEVETPATGIRNLENVILFVAGVTEFINKDSLLKISGDDGHLWLNPNVVLRAERSLYEYLTCIIGAKNVATRLPITWTSSSSTLTSVETTGTTKRSIRTSTVIVTTTVPITGCELDLIIVVDFSSSVYLLHTAYINLAVKIVDQLHVGAYFTRIGMIEYSTSARTRTTFHLNQYQTKENIIKAMREAEYTGGMTNTSAGLELAKLELDPDFGARPKRAQQVIVIFTDGFSQVDPSSSAKRLRDASVTVYAISAAESETEANLEELTNIAGDSSRVFMLNTFAELVNKLSDTSNRCRRK